MTISTNSDSDSTNHVSQPEPLAHEDFLRQGYEQIVQTKRQILKISIFLAILFIAAGAGLHYLYVINPTDNFNTNAREIYQLRQEIMELNKTVTSFEKRQDSVDTALGMLTEKIEAAQEQVKEVAELPESELTPESITFAGNVYTLIADSVKQFSDVQAKHGWVYGYQPANSDELWQISNFKDNAWLSPVDDGPLIGERIVHPYITADGAGGPTVRRWIAQADGWACIAVEVRMEHADSKDGITATVLLDGQELWSELFSVQTSHKGGTLLTNIAIRKGQRLDFSLSHNANTDADGTQFTAKIFIKQ